MYLCHREKVAERSCKHTNHIQKIMFLSAMARPRYDTEGNYVFNGDRGLSLCDYVQAKKKSRYRFVLFHVTHFTNVRSCSLLFTMCVYIFTEKGEHGS
jgi:hypothetical protein